jgi:hypothetical protein
LLLKTASYISWFIVVICKLYQLMQFVRMVVPSMMTQ